MADVRSRLILVFAALWGLAGVALLAAGGHMDPSGRLNTAGSFLLFHAAAAIGLMSNPHVTGWRMRIPALTLLLGSGLFGLEIAVHVLTGWGQLAFLAPVGGTITLLGWLALLVFAGIGLFKTA